MAGAATLAVLPDTQYYASCRETHFAEQTRYLAEHAESLGLLATLQLGDLTEHNTPDEWKYVEHALAFLPTDLPVILATGNHDYGTLGHADERHSLFDDYWGSRPSAATARTVTERMTPHSVENAYYRIPWGRTHLGFLVLEWSPRTATVHWAQGVLERHPEDRIVFITHAYLFHDDSRYDWSAKGDDQPWNPKTYGTAKKDPDLPYSADNAAGHGAYDGQMLWDELLYEHPGVFLTLNGHVLGDGTGLLSSRGESGNLVHQVLVNYQMLEEGGLGYLRLIEISPDGASLHMTTYSPSLDLYATATDQDFQLSIEPPLGAR